MGKLAQKATWKTTIQAQERRDLLSLVYSAQVPRRLLLTHVDLSLALFRTVVLALGMSDQ